jgi:hypothetical protein
LIGDNLLKYEEFKNSEYLINYKFDREDLLKIKIDISIFDFISNPNTTNNKNTNSLTPVQFAKNMLKLYPEIKPILQFLKRFLQLQKLNNAYSGK